MRPTVIRKLPDNVWVADLMGQNHHFKFDTVDLLEFQAMGFDGRAIRFTITPHGVLEKAVDFKADVELDELSIPFSHALRRDITIGKPYKVN